MKSEKVDGTSEFGGLNIHTMNAAPDGITPDEWRRGVALIAAASMSLPYGNTSGNVILIAQKFEKWIKEGDS